MNARKLYRGALACACLAAAIAFSGCGQKVIDHVAFQISPDQKDISVALVFSSDVQSNLSGTFPIKTYGDIFVQPYSSAQPFELGFAMNLAVVNDSDYIHLTPTLSLPNGVPLGIGYPIVEISGASPISPSFDLAGYVDISEQKWFGGAATFSFISPNSFPVGTALTATFDQDANGNPGIMAYVFGPEVDSLGNVQRPGGIAVLANIKQLAGISAQHPGGIVELPPDQEIKLSGAEADRYESFPALMRLQDKFVEELNTH